jgi:Ca2+ transporting ATPase
VNSTALLVPEEKGSSTEIALLKYFQKMGVDYEEERSRHPTKLKYPFSSARKRMSVILDMKGENYLFIKGASEIVLKSCSSWMCGDTGQVKELTGSLRKSIEEVINSMASNSLRTLCLGFKRLSTKEDFSLKD